MPRGLRCTIGPAEDLWKGILDQMVRDGLLVTVFDPEVGEDRYCTPEYKAAAQSIIDGKARAAQVEATDAQA